MADKTLVVPNDLTMEIEALSRKEHRSEHEVLREAIRHYLAFHDAGKAYVAFEQFLASAPSDSLGAIASESPQPNKPSARPTTPKPHGDVSSGRLQADKFDERIEKGRNGSETIPWPRTVGIVSDGSFDPAEDEAYMKEHWKPDW